MQVEMKQAHEKLAVADYIDTGFTRPSLQALFISDHEGWPLVENRSLKKKLLKCYRQEYSVLVIVLGVLQ